jgi:hypothetical protein
LAEKLATAIALGPANTRVRDFSDIYLLTGEHDLELEPVREALQRTTQFRDVTIQPLSAVVRNVVELRTATYAAYRKSLGPYGIRLPEHFDEVVNAVIVFADPLTEPHTGSRYWTGQARRWSTNR